MVDALKTRHLLEKAARRGNAYQVANLLDMMHAEPTDLEKAMDAAVVNGHVDIAAMLLDRGASLERSEHEDQWPHLQRAADAGHLGVVALLLDRGVNVNSQSHSVESALIRAVDRGHYEVVPLLLERGADVNPSDMADRPPLYYAALNNDLEMVSLLLSYGADVDAQSTARRDVTDRESALHAAVGCGHHSMVSLLLKHNADVHLRSKHGRTAFHTALRIGRGSTLALLIRYGSDPRGLVWPEKHEGEEENEDEKDDEEDDGDEDEAVKQEEDYVRWFNENEMHGLHIVAQHGVSEALGLLSDLGVDLDAQTKCGKSPLHIAARFGSRDVITELLDRGVSVNSVDSEGRNALHWAAYEGKSWATETLLDRGADINAADKRGETALHWAMRNTNASFVAFLLDHGANFHAVDSVQRRGKNALGYLLHQSSPMSLEAKLPIVRMLCMEGLKVSPLSRDEDPELDGFNAGLRVCAALWHACYKHSVKIVKVLNATIMSGKQAVKAFVIKRVRDERLLNAVLLDGL